MLPERKPLDLLEADRMLVPWLAHRNAIQAAELAMLARFGCAPPDELEDLRERRRRGYRRPSPLGAA